MYLATVTQKGQVTVPVDYRRFLGLKTNDKVIFEKKDNYVLIAKAKSILDLAGSIKPKKNIRVDPLEAREYMEKNYRRS